MKAFNILPKSCGFSNDYNPRINPNIINSFDAAAYRLHTLVQVSKTFTSIKFINGENNSKIFLFKIRVILN
jgi:hypothetical protein